ncbi:MAG: DegT/DnrJ/EryC1/StrS family aminotransferase [Candidatus Methanoperedens sp.]|nr:DegT/DnrJ/EryC1/StrS family aminotransferase [Candidatus Methanoperedens sp.]MCZ7404618.1 DegT/DnrJ/EryC1/StrS family aminotransferase [Candidatus Methanoperedens sp.]
MIPIAKPIIGEDEINAVTEVLRSGVIAEGQKVKDFETAFAQYTGTSFAVAVNSGTAALHVALLARGVGPGDEVITTPFTFVATANSVLFTGAKPVFADIREDTFNIDPESIIEKITPKTKAIIPVHLYGQPTDMKAIMDIAEDKDLIIIEDACQAHGATFEGKSVGSFGEGTFSFYPTKNMTTSEGGIITTNDKEIARKARMIRSHGSRQRYLHEMLGFNMRMTDIAAAIGLVQLGKIGDFNISRIKNAQYLTKSLQKTKGLILPHIDKRCGHVFHQYTVRIRGDLPRDEVVSSLNNMHIGTGIYYPIPIHKQPFYKELGYNDSLPVSESASKEVISLPVHPSLNKLDLETISGKLKEIMC